MPPLYRSEVCTITCFIYLQENITDLLKIFDQYLETAEETSSHDIIRQSVIILMGSLAKHLEKGDKKVTKYYVLGIFIH